MTTTEHPQRTQEKRRWTAEAHSRGWRGTTNAPRCPLEVAGAYCWHRPAVNYPGGCLCDALRELGALDHVRRWSQFGRPIVTSEPYDWGDERTAEVRDLCAAHGIDVEIGEYSPYFPDETTLLIFRGRRSSTP